ncbi:hypothetical protein [Diaphorobacter aerolatus]|uniref:Uncharacterized protein n=1 Tax=Diaphorobacter aerolatus TaxID=1288495 RepID=A0A7H0GKT8_9BURK|nr:hypothetical protein [Diaphorobacter aerolatus]QNP48904.1 hypothetical protein H9K75_01490 [Diaphorobacter aerolatus]
MNFQEAKELIGSAQNINDHLNNMADMINSIQDYELQKNIKLELGQVMGKVYLGFIHPVIVQFPELDPDTPVENS